MLVTVPRLVQLLYPRRIWKVASEEKSLYLSFDDGPIPEVTPWVLEQLKAHNAQATFFCIGDNIKKHPEVFQQIVAEGHAVGNHTFNHLNGWKTSTKTYVENTLKAGKIMRNSFEGLDYEKMLFRPPYGRITGKQARALEGLGFRIVMWNMISMDFDQSISSEKCFRNVVDNASGGSVVVFHDSLKADKHLRAVLPRVLDHFSNQNYHFKRLN